MRAKPSPLSLTEGFTLFEFLLCITIIGILASIALPKIVSFSQKECLYTLRSKLLKAQNEFFALYSKAIFTHDFVDSPYKILETLAEKKNPECYFEVKKSHLIAHVHKKELLFYFYPQDFSYKPKIYCSYANVMCQEFWGKKSEK